MSLVIDPSYESVITSELLSCNELLSVDNAISNVEIVATRLAGISECFGDKDLNSFFEIVKNINSIEISDKTLIHVSSVILALYQSLSGKVAIDRSKLIRDVKELELMLNVKSEFFDLADDEKKVFLDEMSSNMNIFQNQLDGWLNSKKLESFECYRVAHTLKGFGGMIGFDLMYVLSEYVEKVFLLLGEDAFVVSEDVIEIANGYMDFLKKAYSVINGGKRRTINVENFFVNIENFSVNNFLLVEIYEKALFAKV